jgi:1,4-dihydroxy-2-naphthoyl-CoA hydrolase
MTDHDGRDLLAAMMDVRGTLPERMGIKVLDLSAEQATGTMPVEGNTQPYGLLHGGASCVLAETLGSLAAAVHAGASHAVVGIEISATHHRGAGSGEVTGVATRVHGGRTIVSYEIVISDDEGRRVCTSRLTCLIRERVPVPDSAPPGDVRLRTARKRTTSVIRPIADKDADMVNKQQPAADDVRP